MAAYWHFMPTVVAADVSTMVIAPMPGVVKSVAVKVGDTVSVNVTIVQLSTNTSAVSRKLYKIIQWKITTFHAAF